MRRLITISFVTLALSAGAAAAAPGASVQVWMSYKAGQKTAVKNAVLAAGGTIVYDSADGESLAVRVPKDKLDALGARADVDAVEDDVVRKVSADQFPYGLTSVQARKVWDNDGNGAFDPGAPLGAGRVVCIIDTGFAQGHPDFAGLNVVGGKSFTADGPWYQDHFGHGTHVAGTIAAPLNGVGTVGVAPKASLYIVRAADDDGTMLSSTLMAAVDHCASIGANIINMSLGGPVATKVEDRAFTKLENRGILLIAAAGNDGTTDYEYPASYDAVVSVGALDENNEWASFSQVNPEVELSAPGVDVFSTFPRTQSFTVTADGTPVKGVEITGFKLGTVSGKLEWGGPCNRAGNWSGAIVACQGSGDASFTDFQMNTMIASGAVGLILMPENDFSLSHYSDVSYPIISIPVYSEGVRWLVHNKIGRTVTMKAQDDPVFGWRVWSGTSFATPHVSGVAALIWSKYPGKTNIEVRKAMKATAKDLGDPGKDWFFGNGLVRAKAAMDYLGSH